MRTIHVQKPIRFPSITATEIALIGLCGGWTGVALLMPSSQALTPLQPSPAVQMPYACQQIGGQELSSWLKNTLLLCVETTDAKNRLHSNSPYLLNAVMGHLKIASTQVTFHSLSDNLLAPWVTTPTLSLSEQCGSTLCLKY